MSSPSPSTWAWCEVSKAAFRKGSAIPNDQPALHKLRRKSANPGLSFFFYAFLLPFSKVTSIRYLLAGRDLDADSPMVRPL